MKRTNISLKKWQYEYLKERGRREEKSMSAILRQMIEESARKERGNPEMDVIHDVVGAGDSGSENVARDHDEHLYGTPPERGRD